MFLPDYTPIQRMRQATRRAHPVHVQKRGGRALVAPPDGATWVPLPRVDYAMVKALARAIRWPKMLDTGVHATLEDLARTKSVASSYVIRVLRLTLLAPEIVEAILVGRQQAEMQLDDHSRPQPHYFNAGAHLGPSAASGCDRQRGFAVPPPQCTSARCLLSAAGGRPE